MPNDATPGAPVFVHTARCEMFSIENTRELQAEVRLTDVQLRTLFRAGQRSLGVRGAALDEPASCEEMLRALYDQDSQAPLNQQAMLLWLAASIPSDMDLSNPSVITTLIDLYDIYSQLMFKFRQPQESWKSQLSLSRVLFAQLVDKQAEVLLMNRFYTTIMEVYSCITS